MYIYWSSTGRSFFILNKVKIQNTLKIYFRSASFHSFCRQLNLYGFKRVKGTGFIRFCHPLFKRDCPELLCGIRKENGKNDFLTNFDDFEENEAVLSEKEVEYIREKEIEELKRENDFFEREIKGQQNFSETIQIKMDFILKTLSVQASLENMHLMALSKAN